MTRKEMSSQTESLTAFLRRHYALTEPLECRLLRSYTNDVYEIKTAGERLILKVYGENWRTQGEIAYELSLLVHLADKGLPIAGPIPAGDDADDRWVRQIVLAESTRYAALFEFAPGDKPQPRFNDDLYIAFGKTIGRMHHLSDDFVTIYPRCHLDTRYLIDASLEVILPLLPERETRMFLQDLVREVNREIAAPAETPLDWGPIHGDASMDNLHVTDTGEIVLYDFDSGGPGWRAADLQGWTASGSPEQQQKGAAFQAGYSSVRPLPKTDWRAAPYLTIAWDIWGIRIDLERRVLKQGASQVATYLSEQTARLRERQRAFAGYSKITE